MGKTGKLKAREKLAGGGEGGKKKEAAFPLPSLRFIFVLALSQFS